MSPKRRKRKLRIPAEFDLGGHGWRVEYVENLVHEDGEKCHGICDTDALTILIESAIKGRTIEGETWCHEVAEAINETYEMGLDHPKITTLGVALHQILTTTYFPRRK